MDKFDDRSADSFFEKYRQPDIDISDEELTRFLRSVVAEEQIKSSEMYVIDPEKAKKYYRCVELCREICRDAGISGSMKTGLSPMSHTVYFIDIIAESLSVFDTKKFSEAGKLADVFGVDALEGGNVSVNFTFNRVYKPVS
jgi:hypothetical protein